MFGKKFENKKRDFFNDFFLRHTSSLKSSKMKFYPNPTTDFVTRLPYIVFGNLPKMRKILTYSNGLHHIQKFRAALSIIMLSISFSILVKYIQNIRCGAQYVQNFSQYDQYVAQQWFRGLEGGG